MKEPMKRYALVRAIPNGNVYMRTDAEVLNAWRLVSNGYGADLTWGEVLWWETKHEPGILEVIFDGADDLGVDPAP